MAADAGLFSALRERRRNAFGKAYPFVSYDDLQALLRVVDAADALRTKLYATLTERWDLTPAASEWLLLCNALDAPLEAARTPFKSRRDDGRYLDCNGDCGERGLYCCDGRWADGVELNFRSCSECDSRGAPCPDHSEGAL